MKLYKLFLLLSLMLLLAAKVFGQAAVDIPLIATDGSINREIAFGLDLTATNCIDSLLGEGDPQILSRNSLFDGCHHRYLQRTS